MYPGCCGITRRGFLLGAGAGLAAGAPLGWLAVRALAEADRPEWLRCFTGRPVEVKKPQLAMPGPYPGRVIEVHHPGSVNDRNEINHDAVKEMIDTGMCQLTGADHAVEAWRRFFEPDDIVGVKVNPVGMKTRPGCVGAISSPAVLLEIVNGLKSAGVKPRNIIVFERYANEFRNAGYERVMRERDLDGTRWYASGAGYDNSQLSIDGYDERSRIDRDPHVVGYDPDHFAHMGFAAPDHDPKDDRRFRSHLSVIISRMVNKFVTIPVLKDHRSAGVTLALKNMSHGLNNNVARSHISGLARLAGRPISPNQCNTFIPAAVAQPLIRQKATLHIMDGLIGVYEGGPGMWNRTWATWRHRSLFFATDPVAMDHVGWDIIDAKRLQEGWPRVGEMGLVKRKDEITVSTRLASLAAQTLPDAVALAAVGPYCPGNQETEQFEIRQPDHVALAGDLGLGVFNPSDICYRRINLKA
jgi:uncharacterized protein (DUF362 family)